MGNPEKSMVVLMADDDADDCLLVQEAFEESRFTGVLHCVEDGEALMDYLLRRGVYADAAVSPRPGIILLDLNMPRKDGREALREIRSTPGLCTIPVVVLTTSREAEDIVHSYELGANAFVTKPVTFEGLVELLERTVIYWFETVQLPPMRAEAEAMNGRP